MPHYSYLDGQDPTNISSGAIGSGDLGSGTVQGFFGTTRNIASGTVGNVDFGSGAVIAGTVASGAIVSGNLASGQIGRFHVASGQFAGFELGSGAIVSGRIASGQIGFGHLADGSVQSGTVGSGQLSTNHFASGSIIDFARMLRDGNFISAEILSGPGMAIALTTSGALQLAMAGNPNRMPAVGVITSNYLSGVSVIGFRNGVTYGPTWNFSGWPNETTFVGESGTLIASGTPLSGSTQQIVGTTINASGIFLQIGDPLTQVTVLSGDLGSGQVGSVHLASGTTAFGIIRQYAAFGTLSGMQAVAFASGQQVVLAAERASGLRLPAIGVSISGALSGVLVSVVEYGPAYGGTASGIIASGFAGRPLYVGSGGLIVNQSGFMGGASSGAPALSGDGIQFLGLSISGGIFVKPEPYPRSGLLTAAAQDAW